MWRGFLLGGRLRVRHAVFGLAVALYVLTVGQNWAHYAAAVMVAAWVRHDGRVTNRTHQDPAESGVLSLGEEQIV